MNVGDYILYDNGSKEMVYKINYIKDDYCSIISINEPFFKLNDISIKNIIPISEQYNKYNQDISDNTLDYDYTTSS